MQQALGPVVALCVAGAGAAALTAARLKQRLELSWAKQPTLAGHPRIARRLAGWLPARSYGEDEFFASDGATAEVIARRRAGFKRLAELYRTRFAHSAAHADQTADLLSDQQFIAAYRVPFQYSAFAGARLAGGNVLQASDGVMLTDLDGNRFYDVTGSYGVNVLGYDVYKACIRDGAARVEALGPVLGSYHPLVAGNVRRLCRISGLDQVSFHMSGTEAVMQAVRLARYHTRRRYLVRFCGAYHGWWGDVQPGIGNPQTARDTFTLKEMDEASLRVLRRRRDIACVLVNPLQALHPNRAAPGDSALVDSSRQAAFDRAAYRRWLGELRRICTERGIVLIIDEVLTGFRLAPGGAQEFFGIRADLVTYGKTIAGGLPIGAVCGRRDLMQRFRPDRPADICFARGTFHSHPYVMGAMDAFLERFDSAPVRLQYEGLERCWNDRATRLNERLAAAALPVRVANLSTVWTVCYLTPSRYNWMLQFYLRAAGLALSWVGTGRLIFSLNYTAADFDAVADRFVAGAAEMAADGWWTPGALNTNRAIRRRVLREAIERRLGLSRDDGRQS
jgi:glutamate-1-semialdehyde 2,1-aminomutase